MLMLRQRLPFDKIKTAARRHAGLVTVTPSSRCLSTSTAGRKRFYVDVDVAPWAPAWEESKLSRNEQPSPVSAGVDGTDSASGVQHPNGALLRRRDLLQPRTPGLDMHPDNNNKNELLDDSITSWYTVRLDQRPLKTPQGQPLSVPSQALAYALAAEWNVQVSDAIRPAQMPLMTLVATALDQTTLQHERYQQQILRFLQTDTVCYYADPLQERDLYERQQAAWKELHAFTEQTWQHAPAMAVGYPDGVVLAKSLQQLPHPPGLTAVCGDWVASLDAWHLMALHSMAAEAKSFFIAAGLLLNSQNWSVASAMEAARVEEEFNIANWGLVEGGHDYDRLNCSVQLHAAVVLKDFLAMDGMSKT